MHKSYLLTYTDAFCQSDSAVRDSVPNYNVNHEIASANTTSRKLIPDSQRFKYYDAIKTGFEHIEEEGIMEDGSNDEGNNR